MVSRTLLRPILDQKFGSSLVFIWPLGSWDPGPGSLDSYSNKIGRASQLRGPLRAEYGSVQQFVFPLFLQPGQAIFAI
jgi:hypothetical protein